MFIGMIIRTPRGYGCSFHVDCILAVAQVLDGFGDTVGLRAQVINFVEYQALRLAPLPTRASTPFDAAFEVLEEIRLVEPDQRLLRLVEEPEDALTVIEHFHARFGVVFGPTVKEVAEAIAELVKFLHGRIVHFQQAFDQLLGRLSTLVGSFKRHPTFGVEYHLLGQKVQIGIAIVAGRIKFHRRFEVVLEAAFNHGAVLLGDEIGRFFERQMHIEPVKIAHLGAFRDGNCFYVHCSLFSLHVADFRLRIIPKIATHVKRFLQQLYPMFTRVKPPKVATKISVEKMFQL